MDRHKHNTRKGFTLIELLVVISVIALLVTILVPSLAGARHLAMTVKCATSERAIGASMLLYGEDFNDAIVGNAWTSGAFLKTAHSPAYNDWYCPNVCQTWDWTAPIAKEMGWGFDSGPSLASRANRYVALTNLFLCPENNIKAAGYSASPITVTTAMLSFNTALMFQYAYSTTATDLSLYQSYIDTGSYQPRISQVGMTSAKIFLSDGARWTQDDASPPDYDLVWDGTDPRNKSPGGAYADYGPWSQYSRSFLRNTPMVYAMRHGSRVPGAPLSTYKFNAVFFDGHVETLSGQTGMNPQLWLPAGTALPSSELSQETTGLFAGSGSVSVIP
jgi:prepilin-type N-terminal cleavage/methylation domain-containing protein/prepilin-type processing-associated H-X9-DG protein